MSVLFPGQYSEMQSGSIDLSNYKNAEVVDVVSMCLADYSGKNIALQFGVFLVSNHFGESDVTVFTLPAYLHPSHSVYGILRSVDGSYMVQAKISTEGKIMLTKTPDTQKYLSGQICFIK